MNNNLSKYLHVVVLCVLFSGSVFLYQNCSDVQFGLADYVEKASLSVYTVNEDEVLEDQLPQDIPEFYHRPGIYQTTSTPSNGSLDSVNAENGSFIYRPNLNYTGEDSFTYSIKIGEQVFEKTAYIDVLPVNDAPRIITDELHFQMNTVDNVFALEVVDVEPGNITIMFSETNPATLNTPNGLLKKVNGQTIYTPKIDFRGTEEHRFYVKDAGGMVISKVIRLIVGNPFHNIEPAMAVRASGCVTCHAVIDASYITDLGVSSDPSDNFWGKTGSLTQKAFTSSYYGDQHFSWMSAKFKKDIIVPKHSSSNGFFGYDLSTESSLNDPNNFVNRHRFKDYVGSDGFADFKAGLSLKSSPVRYIKYIESFKPTPATVVKKESIYIGSPSIAKLKGLGNGQLKLFRKNSNESPALSGISGALAINGLNTKYFKNTNQTITCDGDLILDGSLLLDSPKIRTIEGCRIYATGPIYLQGKITYEDLTPNDTNNTNLQLVSARMVSLGVGLNHCSDPFYSNPVNGTDNPMKKRLVMSSSSSMFTRVQRELGYTSPDQEGAELLDLSTKISQTDNVGLVDASCNPNGGRELVIERLLVNAPILFSRYTGSYTGVIIGELPLFSLSHFSFKFDQVFKRVPVLPILELQDFLDVK